MSNLVTPNPSLLSVERRDVGHRTVLAVSGEVDIASSPVVRSAVESALDAGAHELWIDLGATTFIDSSGLHVLVEMDRRAETLRRRLTIICPPGNVRRVFDLTGVVNALRVHDDLAAAQRDA